MTDARRSGMERRSIPRDTKDRRRGRPRVADVSVRVSVRLPVDTYDRLDLMARRLDTSIPALIRRRVVIFGAE
jgi:hypothetical protein